MSEKLAASILRLLQKLQTAIVLAAFAVLVLVVFADVVSRELTGAGLYWASQTGVWANVLVVMGGFGLASAAGGHLRPRFADNWLPATWSTAVACLQHVVMAAFCFAIGWLALSVTYETWELGEVSIQLMLPVWPVQLFLPAAFLCAGIQHIIYGCCHARLPPLMSFRALLSAGLKDVKQP